MVGLDIYETLILYVMYCELASRFQLYVALLGWLAVCANLGRDDQLEANGISFHDTDIKVAINSTYIHC